ncbi:guanine nucleotide exchange factor synembryn-domain-containing protein [Entophlyctis helioformis]|nr:guanine nucleotide exchange factor synembryn-domain-containing protein [Entophlyctis helioformis]
MDAFVALSEQQRASAQHRPAVAAQLAAFVAAHGSPASPSAALGLVGGGVCSASAKAAFADSLLALVSRLVSDDSTDSQDSQDSADALAQQALHCLRILTRETAGCDPLFKQSSIALLARVAGLAAQPGLDGQPPAAFSPSAVAVESLKVLSNTLLQDSAARYHFAATPAVDAAAAALSTRPSLPIGPVFLLTRLVFIATAGSRDVSLRLIHNGTCVHLAYLLKEMVEGRLVPTPQESWISVDLARTEILKTAFNMSVPVSEAGMSQSSHSAAAGGGLFGGIIPPPAGTTQSSASSIKTTNTAKTAVDNQTEDDAAPSERDRLAVHFGGLLQTAIVVAKQTPLARMPLVPPHSHIINFMMNLPVKSLAESWFPAGATSIVRLLVDILAATLKECFPRRTSVASTAASKTTPAVEVIKTVGAEAADHDEHDDDDVKIEGMEADQALAPLLLVLKTLANEHPESRAILGSLLMPDDIDRTKPLSKGTAITNYLISFMTSVTLLNIRECVFELFLAICEQNTGRLVSYVGYGHAAGFLMSRGLLNANGGVAGAAAPAHGHGQGHSQSGSDVDINPITGELRSKEERPDPFAGMSEEEKEAEAEKLFVLFDRLNKTGVIQVVQKGDGDGGGGGV